MDKFEQKPNESYCFAKEGFAGFSGVITITEPGEYWVSVYDNEGKKGAYRAVKLKPKQKKHEGLNPVMGVTGQAASFDDDEAPW